jgi:hypothetical protein
LLAFEPFELDTGDRSELALREDCKKVFEVLRVVRTLNLLPEFLVGKEFAGSGAGG